MNTLRRTGLEPVTFGSVDRCSKPVSDGPATTYDTTDPKLTALLTYIRRVYPDLAAIVKAWPTLSEQAKADVLTVINASQQQQSATECK